LFASRLYLLYTRDTRTKWIILLAKAGDARRNCTRNLIPKSSTKFLRDLDWNEKRHRKINLRENYLWKSRLKRYMYIWLSIVMTNKLDWNSDSMLTSFWLNFLGFSCDCEPEYTKLMAFLKICFCTRMPCWESKRMKKNKGVLRLEFQIHPRKRHMELRTIEIFNKFLIKLDQSTKHNLLTSRKLDNFLTIF